MPRVIDLKKKPSQFGGRPRNTVWLKYEEISSTKVRCKKCLSILPKRIDRVKVHDSKCNNAEDNETCQLSGSDIVPGTKNSAETEEELEDQPSTSKLRRNLLKFAYQPQTTSEIREDITAGQPEQSEKEKETQLRETGENQNIDPLLTAEKNTDDIEELEISRPLSRLSNITNESSSAMIAEVDASLESIITAPTASQRWPISSTPLKRSNENEAFNKPKHIKKQQQSSCADIGKYTIKTSKEKIQVIKEKWAQFFYKNRIPFSVADDVTFHEALEETRPGLKNKSILTRKQLAGPLLDDAYNKVIDEMKVQFKDKMCVVSQDGWSNIHNEPIVASTLHCEGKSYPLDCQSTGSESKTAQYCFELAKTSILKAEKDYGALVIGFVSDNEAKMKLLRQFLLEWRPDMIVYGCSAHYLNLAESTATPSVVLKAIKDVQRYFREHHQPKGWLKEKNGLLPQLPNSTRWTSQRACLDTFVKNHDKYVEIRDENASKISHNITNHIDNRLLLVEAKHMLQQLDIIAKALNSFQDDNNTLADCTSIWLQLIFNPKIKEELRDEIKRRFDEVKTPQHLLSYLLDHRKDEKDEDAEQSEETIFLTEEEQEVAHNFVFEKYENLTVVLAAYETKDISIFSKMTFLKSMKKLLPLKYWQYIRLISNHEPVKTFCSLMMAVSSCPPSSAGIEWLFSSMALIQTKLRNRLDERVGKLVHVYRHFGWKDVEAAEAAELLLQE